MMSAQKPTFRRVFSDSWRIISSNSLHFLALSALFIFPPALLSAIHTLTSTTPVSSPYGRLFSMQQDSKIPLFHKSQLLFFLLSILFNLCAVSSITHSIFHGFHNKPFTLSSSLKSTTSSFFRLLATKLAYALIVFAVVFVLGFLTAFFFMGLALLGFAMKPDSPNLMVFVFVIVGVSLVMLVYLEVEWFVVDASVVVESKFGFSPFKRSWKLVKGARGVALSILLVLGVLQTMLWMWYSSLASRISGGGIVVGVQLGFHAAASALLLVFSVGVHTVFFGYCSAFNGELELPTRDKVYAPLPRDVEDV